MRIIDLFGLPGSGKTTTANALCSYWSSKNISCYKMSNIEWISGKTSGCRILHKIRVFLCLLKPSNFFMFFSLLELFRKLDLLDIKTLKKIIGIWSYFAQLDVAEKKGTYITDNGLFQTLSTAFLFHDISLELISKAMEMFTKKKSIFSIDFCYIEEDSQTCLDRVFNRDKEIRIKSLDRREAFVEIQKQQVIMEYIYELAKSAGLKILKVNSNTAGVDLKSYCDVT